MNLLRLTVFPLAILVIFSLPSSLNYTLPSVQQSDAQVQNNTIVPNLGNQQPPVISQPLVSANAITKSFSFPTMNFYGIYSANVTQTISWYQNGTVRISDDQGNNMAFDIPILGGNFTLWQNDTTIDQKFASKNLQYDVYWKPMKNADGFVNKYKFTISGNSANGYQMQFPLRTTENLVPQGSKFLAISTDNLMNNATSFQGLGLDWSDAVSSGYSVSLDKNSHYVTLNVGKSFSIDPTTVDTMNDIVSPQSTDYYEGERRVVQFGGNIFAFYFDGSNLAYRPSTDGGITWGGKTDILTGAIAPDRYRWTVATTSISGTNYVDLLYYTVSGSVTNFYGVRGTVTGASISWNSPTLIFSISGTNLAAATAASTDSNGNVFAAFRYLSGGQFNYVIYKSTDGGLSWPNSLSSTAVVTCCRIEMTLSPLASGNMLFAYAKYDSAELTYRTYISGTWNAEQTTSNSGMSASTFKQISSDSDGTRSPYVAYLTGGTSGALKVARWNNDGSFNTFETADNTLSHSLPSITITSDDKIHIYTLANSKVYETQKLDTWKLPYNPFGSTFSSPNELTAGISLASAFWEENSAAPFNLRFGTPANSAQSINVASTSSAISPSSTDYYEGEKRVVNIAGTVFAFYFDGSNIVYKYSTNNGISWSAAITAGTGTGSIAPDSTRWTVATTSISGTNYVDLLYYTVSGSNTNFNGLSGTVSGTNISWNSPALISSVSGSSLATAAAASTDSNGNVFAAFRYISGGSFSYAIYESTNGGVSWSVSLSPFSSGSTTRIPITLSPLASGNMLFAYAKFGSAELTYRTYISGTWHTEQTTNGAGMSTNAAQQISSDSDKTRSPYVAYVTGGTSGALKVARWSNGGSFITSDIVDTGLSHSLPSITITSDGIISIYTLSGGTIYETRQIGTWLTPTKAYGQIFGSPNELTAGISFASAFWEENSAAPFNLQFDTSSEKWNSGGSGYKVSYDPSTNINQEEDYNSFHQSNDASLMVDNVQDVTNQNCDIFRSTDGGVTWSTSFTILNPDTGLADAGDPVVGANRGGTMYAACLSFARDSNNNPLPGDHIKIFSSTDGVNWPQVGSSIVAPSTAFYDKDWIAVDKSNSNNENNVYACWTSIGSTTSINFERIVPFDSTIQTLATGTDNGDHRVQGCNIAIGPNGQVYVTWEHHTSATAGNIEMSRNYNGGIGSFTANSQPVATYIRTGMNCGGDGDCIKGYANSHIYFLHYPSVAVDSNGFIHIVFSNYNTVTLGDIQYVESLSNNCVTSAQSCSFTTPITINMDAAATQPVSDQFHPVLTVSTKTLVPTLHVTVMDRRDDTADVIWRPYDYSCHLYTDCTKSYNWYNTQINGNNNANYDTDASGKDYQGLSYSNLIEDYTTWTDHRNMVPANNYDIYGDKITP